MQTNFQVEFPLHVRPPFNVGECTHCYRNPSHSPPIKIHDPFQLDLLIVSFSPPPPLPQAQPQD